MKADLYRHFDREGRLLYVGVSLNVVQRLIGHLYNSGWYDEIATITVEKFQSRGAAELAEEKAVKDELPKYNKRMKRKAGELSRFDPASEPEMTMDQYLEHWRKSGAVT